MKKYFKFFIYISIAFLAYTLYKFDYLTVPRIYHKTAIIFSLLLIVSSYIAHSISWWKTLIYNGYNINLKKSIISVGLSIFGQYIPGKFWMIVGRASYIAEKEKLPVGQLSMLSLSAQFTSLWISFVLGIIWLIFFVDKPIWLILSVIALVLLTVAVFSDYFHRIGELMAKKLFRKNLSIPKLYWRQTAELLPWFFLPWLLWSVGFYLMIVGLTNHPVDPQVALIWPLAASLGILFLISPGGLGIREGILTGCLVIAGLPIQEATTISVISRLVFLIGEVAIFILALLMQRLKQK